MAEDRGYGQRGGGVNLGAIQTDAAGRVLCRWCRKPVSPPRKTWCSQICVDEYLSRAQWPVMRQRIIERDKICQLCGGHSYDQGLGNRYRIPIAYDLPEDKRLASDLDGWAVFTHHQGRWASPHESRVRRFAKEQDGVWDPGSYCVLEVKWEVDHIIAVKDGGTDDPSNLRLLCVPCHKKVSADQRARWASQARQAGLFDGV